LATKLRKRTNYWRITKHILFIRVHIYERARRSLDPCHCGNRLGHGRPWRSWWNRAISM